MSKSEVRRRPFVVGVRMDPDEHQRGLDLAGRSGISLPELMRRSLNDLGGRFPASELVRVDEVVFHDESVGEDVAVVQPRDPGRGLVLKWDGQGRVSVAVPDVTLSNG